MCSAVSPPKRKVSGLGNIKKNNDKMKNKQDKTTNNKAAASDPDHDAASGLLSLEVQTEQKKSDLKVQVV